MKKLFYTISLLLSLNSLAALSFFDAGESATGAGDAGIVEAIETDLRHDTNVLDNSLENEFNKTKNELRKIEADIQSSNVYNESRNLAHEAENKIRSGYQEAKNLAVRAEDKIKSASSAVYADGKHLAEVAGSKIQHGYEKTKEYISEGAVKSENYFEGLWSKIKAIFKY